MAVSRLPSLAGALRVLAAALWLAVAGVVTGTSHWPHMDEPEEFNRILDGFLASAR